MARSHADLPRPAGPAGPGWPGQADAAAPAGAELARRGRDGGRPLDRRAVLVGGMALLVVNAVVSAPEPPLPAERWRWAAIVVAGLLCVWNVSSAYTAYLTSGLLSMSGFFHTWCLLAFSFPAAETTYRYRTLRAGHWTAPTDQWLSLKAVLVLGVFELLFFLALGRDVPGGPARLARGCAARRPNFRAALWCLVVLAPFALAKLSVLLQLGLSGILGTMVTRKGYWLFLDTPESTASFLLNSFFPVYSVSLACFAVKYLVPHPSAAGRRLFGIVLLVSGAGVAGSGGRAELAYVLLTVLVFMHVQGYRFPADFRPVVVPAVLVAFTLLLVAQARHGAENTLSTASKAQDVGYSYQRGDVTQTLGVGRFDAVLLILDHLDTQPALWGKSYGYAVLGAVNSTYAPRVALGHHLPMWRISDQVMAYWIFGRPLSSALPSTPGELLLNFGYAGIVLGALAFGLAFRVVTRWLLGLRGPVEVLVLLSIWILARTLSDESWLMATYAASNLPGMVLLALALGLGHARQPAHPVAGQPHAGSLPALGHGHARQPAHRVVPEPLERPDSAGWRPEASWRPDPPGWRRPTT
ncbi:MAG TPA: O-antigen polymerase [Actinomycetes bacterium]|nr:O-antigen polymerase [Actinomycetes bacterium]